ncbi:MAG: hypothetical protein IJ460_00150 [Clostridia bacterium]|nr:hypothetical protein [Clostridia bacterium]
MEIIEEITSSSWEKGTREYKIAALYNSVLDKENRNKQGTEPIKKYLELIEAAENIDDLISAHNTIFKDTCLSVFFEFNLTVDIKNSTEYMLYFETISPLLQKEFYIEDSSKREMYLTYLSTMLELGGETKDKAAVMAQQYIDTEKVLAGKMLDVADQNNVDIIYNVFSFQELKEMFAGVNIDSVFEASGLKQTDKILITDVEKTKALAGLLKNENIDALKTHAKFNLLSGWGASLNQEFSDTIDKFNQDYFGISGSYSDEEKATRNVRNLLADYIGEIYVEKHFSEQAKTDVEKMVDDIITVYRNRLQNNDWMRDETKEKHNHRR